MLYTTNLLSFNYFHICSFLSHIVLGIMTLHCKKGVYRECNILHDTTFLSALKLWEMCFTKPKPKTKCCDLKQVWKKYTIKIS